MTRDTVRLDDEELVAAIDERAEELGSRSEAYREAVRRAYLEDETTTDSDDDGATLPKAAREGYAALREHANAGERMAIDTAESIIAQRVQLRKETVRSSVIRKLHGAGWLAVEQGIHQVSVVLRPRTASDGGRDTTNRDADVLDDSDADEVDVDAEFERLESAEIDRGDGVETDGGTDTDRLRCPYNGCDWKSRAYDPNDYLETIVREEDAVIHWEDEHGGEIPDSAEFGYEQCPECYAGHGLLGMVSCSECGYIPAEVRADGGSETIAVSPTTGVIYAVSDYALATDDGQIIAEDKRPLSRAEIGARLPEVHGPARRCYREHLGGDRDA